MDMGIDIDKDMDMKMHKDINMVTNKNMEWM